MPISNNTLVAKVIAAGVLEQYRRSRVVSARVNNTWRNALNAGGNEVIIPQPGSATIQDYATTPATVDYTAGNPGPVTAGGIPTAAGGITYTAVDTGTPLTLTIDKRKAWAIKFNDLDRAATNRDLLAESTREHGEALAEVVDRDVAVAMNANATAASTKTLNHTASRTATSGTAVTTSLRVENLELAAVHRTMDLNLMPRTGRWAIIDPFMAEVIQSIALANEVIIAAPNSQDLVNGNVGAFAGFQWYVATGRLLNNEQGVTSSVSIPSAPATGAGVRSLVLFGNDTATGFIDRITRTERLRLESDFADAVRGLYTYGTKVLKTDRLVKKEYLLQNVPGVTNTVPA